MASQSVNDTLTWTVHPARKSPWAAVPAVGVIVALAVAAASLMESVWWGALSLLLLLLPLHRYFLPNRYVLDESGATAGTPLHRRRIRWGDVRCCDVGSAGVLLSSRFRPAAYGGGSVILLFRDNAAEVVARVESHLREASSDVAATAEVHHAPPV